MTSKRLLDPVSKCLLDAADYIETHGHHKGSLLAGSPWLFHGAPRAACVIGAILSCQGTGEIMANAQLKLAKHLNLQFKTVGSWNDAPERTKDEVVNALREAAIATI